MTLALLFTALPLALLAILVTKLFHDRKRQSKLPYPPGPKPTFLIGNLFDFPKTNSAKVFTEWGKTYDSVLYIGMSNVFFTYNVEIRWTTFCKSIRAWSHNNQRCQNSGGVTGEETRTLQ